MRMNLKFNKNALPALRKGIDHLQVRGLLLPPGDPDYVSVTVSHGNIQGISTIGRMVVDLLSSVLGIFLFKHNHFLLGQRFLEPLAVPWGIIAE